ATNGPTRAYSVSQKASALAPARPSGATGHPRFAAQAGGGPSQQVSGARGRSTVAQLRAAGRLCVPPQGPGRRLALDQRGPHEGRCGRSSELAARNGRSQRADAHPRDRRLHTPRGDPADRVRVPVDRHGDVVRHFGGRLDFPRVDRQCRPPRCSGEAGAPAVRVRVAPRSDRARRPAQLRTADDAGAACGCHRNDIRPRQPHPDGSGDARPHRPRQEVRRGGGLEAAGGCRRVQRQLSAPARREEPSAL
ncbi:MAG: cAMP-binding proteins - catabolite gene activator and regulatory subunit of cAMP-dependent protein kinases, partial [uncultured Sphingosinicella sp.]